MKGTGAKRNVCPGSCESTGAKFPVAPVESAPMAAAWARRARDIDRLLPGAQHSLAACSRKCEQCRVYRLAVAVNVAAASATLCCAPTEDEKSKEARGETTEDAVTTSAHGTECLGHGLYQYKIHQKQPKNSLLLTFRPQKKLVLRLLLPVLGAIS